MRWIRNEGYFERLVMLLILLPFLFVYAAIDWSSETLAIIVLGVTILISIVISPFVARPLLNRWSRDRE